RDVDKLRKDKVKVWIMSAAVAEIPARVHVEVHEIRQPPDLLGAGRFATRERPEGVQIHRLCADRNKKGVQKMPVAKFIVGVVVDVYGHVLIKDFKGVGVGCITTPARDFAVLDSAEFVVLLPEIALDDFSGGQKPQDGHIAGCDIATRFCRGGIFQQSSTNCSCSDGE